MERVKRARTASPRRREAEEGPNKRRRAVREQGARGEESGVSEAAPDSSQPGDNSEQQAMQDASPALQASPASGLGMAVLAAAAQPAPAPLSQQAERRQHGNWSAAEDVELLSLANTFHRSWSVVLARSTMLRERQRTVGACSKRYTALKNQRAARAARPRLQQEAALAAQGMAPGEVGPQSADPGEGLHQVSNWQALAPIDRSVRANYKQAEHCKNWHFAYAHVFFVALSH